MESIGARIKKRREELNMTQAELARILGYKSRTSIHKMELGERGLPQKKIKQLAEALHTTPEYIMGWEEKPKDELDQGAHKIKITKSDGKIIVFDTSAIVKAINKALEILNEPAQNKVLDYINDLKENNKNLRNFVENLPKNKKR
ncbi:MAG: hypothetical protein DBY32_04595 [Phascolarctobacterium sp.]|nr:MAG: hypothetical protein DBY32_04595 [Phascolarctobacterium sp.]